MNRVDADICRALIWDDRGEVSLKNIARPVRLFERAGSVRVAEKPSLPLPDKPSIAVLPFTNMSGDPEQEYFADGLVEDIIGSLSRIRSFFVIARNSTFVYKGKPHDVREIGRALGVRYVMEGSVRRAGGRVRITCQLVESDSGRPIWSDRFEANTADVFDLQDDVTQAVAGAIEPNLRIAETERIKDKSTRNLSAYEHYLLALHCSYTWTRVGFQEAMEHLEKAISIDPTYALAKGTGSRIVMMKRLQSWATDEEVAKGVAWAREAIAEGNNDPLALRCAGHAVAMLGRDFDLGLFALRRAMSIAPNSAQVLSGSGWVHAYVGQTDRAIDHFERAIRLSPLDPEMVTFLTGLALAHFVDENYEAAFEHALRAIPKVPSAVPLRMAAATLGKLGRVDEAKVFARRLLDVTPEFRLSRVLVPNKCPTVAERFVAGLRAAGIPE